MRKLFSLGLFGAFALAACSSPNPNTTNNNTVEHTLTVTALGAGSGSVTSNPAGIDCGAACSASFDEGTQVILTATADSSSVFTGWTGCDSTSGSTCTVTMSGDKTVSPSFAVFDTFTFTIAGTGTGTVTDDQGGTWTSTWTAGYADGSQVTFTATPDGNDTFTWGGDCAGVTTDTCTVTIGANTSVEVDFDAPVLDSVPVTIGGTGSGTVGDGSGTTWTSSWTGSYQDGSTVTFTATPDGTDTVVWGGDCAGTVGNTCTVTISSTTTVTVDFNLPYDDVAVVIAGNGTGVVGDGSGNTWTSSWTGSYLDGSAVTFTATPDAKSVVTWGGACAGNGGNTCTVTVSPSTTVSISFDEAEANGLVATAHLQSVDLAWGAATPSGGVSGYNVYVSTDGGSTWGSATFTSTPSISFASLTPDTSYEYLVTTVYASDGSESPGVTTSTTTGFSGSTADFTSSQLVSGIGGRDFYLTWSGTTLYVAVAKGTQSEALDPTAKDSLLVGLDTDASGSDTNGINVIPGVACDGMNCPSWAGTTDITMPFNLDDALELTNNGGAADVLACTSAGCTASSTGSGVIAADDSIAEAQIDASELGGGTPPAQARVVLIAANLNTGYTFDFAPASTTGATDVLGDFASLTSCLDLGSTIFNPADAATSLSAATQEDAPDLVTFTVDASTAGLSEPPLIQGSVHPLTYADGATVYSLNSLGSGIYSGTFNMGGSVSTLYFEYYTHDGSGNVVPETGFGGGKDRVYTLSGATESLPDLTYGVTYDGANPYTVNFVFDDDGTQGTPYELRGSTTELGNWTVDAGPAVTLVPGTTSTYDTSVTFAAGEDPTVTAVEWKIGYPNSVWENPVGTPDGNHGFDDDIIDHATLQWVARDSTYF